MEKKLRELTAKREKDQITVGSQTVATWMRAWFEQTAVKRIRPRTASTYRSKIENYIIPSIGKVRLDKLTPLHVRQMHQYVTDTLELSSTTALQAHRILADALEYALRDEHVTRNVAKLTDAPRKATANLGVLTAQDGIAVLRVALTTPPGGEPDRLGSRWAAALLTGARQGELLGLELDRVGDDLDLSWQLQRVSWEHGCKSPCGRKRGTDCPNRKITMPADWEYRPLEGGLLLCRPKSKSGWRIIPLVEPLKSIIAARVAQAATEPNPHGLLWTADRKKSKGGNHALLPLDGSPIDPSRDSAAWHAILERAGLQKVRLHDARHTTASLLLEANVPEPIIMKLLGHNSYAVTRAYQNVDRRQLDKALTQLSALLPTDVDPPVVG